MRVRGGHFSSMIGRRFLMTTRSMNTSGEHALKEGWRASNSLNSKTHKSSEIVEVMEARHVLYLTVNRTV